MDRLLLSEHKLLTDYSKKGNFKSIITVWIVVLAIFAVSKIPAVQNSLTLFAESARVEWVTSSVNFFINGIWIVFIPMIIFSIINLMKKQDFDILRIYDSGLGFFDSKTQNEKFEEYNKIYLSYGSMQESFYIDAKSIGISSTSNSYGCKEFEQSELLHSNLKKYASWNKVS